MENERLLKLIIVALPILVIISLVVIYSTTKNTLYLQSPEATGNSFCTNRVNSAIVCKGNTICQCYENNSSRLFFANNNEECPQDCNSLKPASSEGDLGTCSIASIIAKNIPSCYAGCEGKEILQKTKELTNDCCQITLERPCIQ